MRLESRKRERESETRTRDTARERERKLKQHLSLSFHAVVVEVGRLSVHLSLVADGVSLCLSIPVLPVLLSVECNFRRDKKYSACDSIVRPLPPEQTTCRILLLLLFCPGSKNRSSSRRTEEGTGKIRSGVGVLI